MCTEVVKGKGYTQHIYSICHSWEGESHFGDSEITLQRKICVILEGKYEYHDLIYSKITQTIGTYSWE